MRSLIERNKYARLHPGPKTVRTAVETDAIVSRIPLVLRGDVREAMRLQGLEDPAGLDSIPEPRTRIVGN